MPRWPWRLRTAQPSLLQRPHARATQWLTQETCRTCQKFPEVLASLHLQIFSHPCDTTLMRQDLATTRPIFSGQLCRNSSSPSGKIGHCHEPIAAHFSLARHCHCCRLVHSPQEVVDQLLGANAGRRRWGMGKLRGNSRWNRPPMGHCFAPKVVPIEAEPEKPPTDNLMVDRHCPIKMSKLFWTNLNLILLAVALSNIQ